MQGPELGRIIVMAVPLVGIAIVVLVIVASRLTAKSNRSRWHQVAGALGLSPVPVAVESPVLRAPLLGEHRGRAVAVSPAYLRIQIDRGRYRGTHVTVYAARGRLAGAVAGSIRRDLLQHVQAPLMMQTVVQLPPEAPDPHSITRLAARGPDGGQLAGLDAAGAALASHPDVQGKWYELTAYVESGGSRLTGRRSQLYACEQGLVLVDANATEDPKAITAVLQRLCDVLDAAERVSPA